MKRFSFSEPLKITYCIFMCASLLLSSGNCQAREISGENNEHIKCLKDIGKGFTSVALSATPAVVSIEVHNKIDDQSMFRRHPFFDGQNDSFDFFNDDFFHNFFGRQFKHHRFQQPQENERNHTTPEAPAGRGSGCIIRHDGYILTNNHVIKNASNIRVKLTDGREFEAAVIGSDAASDIAILKIEETNLPYLKMGDSDALEVGEWVVAIGNPLGLQASVTAGIVSAKGRDNLNITDFGDLIQTDAAINPGNSGGPLLDLDGEIIGINTAIMSTSGGYMGLGFAVPSNIARHITDQLISTGEVSRGFLGIMLQNLDKDLIAAFNLENAEGALITDIVPESPAEKSGLKRGDVILFIDGKKIKNASSVTQKVGLQKPGSTISMVLFCNGKQEKINVEIADRSKVLASSSEGAEKIGIEVQGSDSNNEGLVISQVIPGSPAARAGIRVGDILISVNKQDVTAKEDYYSLLAESLKQKKILLLLKQGKAMRYIQLSF